MEIPHIGIVTKDREFDWLYSEPMKVAALGGKVCRLVREDYENDENKEEFHAAIENFMEIDESPLRDAAEHIFQYYRYCADNFDVTDDEDFPTIESPDDVWGYVHLGSEPMFTRRAYGDKAIYVSLECGCDWEEEHGLQIVFKNGRTVNKVGAYDGHVTNSDAYADESLENVVYY